MRSRWIAGIAWCVGVAAPARGEECVDLAVALQAQDKLERRNQEAYESALARKGLEPIALRTWTVPRGSGGGSGREAEGTIQEERRGGRAIRVLVGPKGGLVCGQAPAWELAKNQKGELYAVDRVRKLTKRVRWETCQCHDPPMTCGGAAPQPVRRYYELPDALVFKGHIRVEHAFQSGTIGNPKRCPKRDPPP